MIGRICERGSGISMLAARHDDDDDDDIYSRLAIDIELLYNLNLKG